MFGHHHPLTQSVGPTKIAWGLSLAQVIALLIGAQLSYKLFLITPSLPLNNVILANIHALIPFAVAALLAFARETQTGLNYARYLTLLIMFKLRCKTFVWRR